MYWIKISVRKNQSINQERMIKKHCQFWANNTQGENKQTIETSHNIETKQMSQKENRGGPMCSEG